MSEFSVALGAFHFIRPAVLVLVPAILVLWWIVRRGRTRRENSADGLAPHLRAALTVGGGAGTRVQPIDGVAVGLALLALGAAGPTWSRMPDPFVAQSAPVVVVLEVTPSMAATDVAPSRLERGKQKIRDLLDLRAGARTALVAYAGSAHRVVPMTEDAAVMTPYLEGLSAEVMPREGADAAGAFALAASILAAEDAPGSVLLVADGLEPADAAAFDADGGPGLAVLSMLPDGVRDRGFDALSGASIVPVTPDGGDVRALDRALNAAYRQAILEDGDQPWDDRGYLLAWPAALLALLWFRRGWTMRWAALIVLGFVSAPGPARADGLADLFVTPDQQGRRAFEDKDFGAAAEAFVDPLWRGYALYRDGQYPAAIEVLNRIDTAQAAFIQGMAAIKNRAYRDAVRAFEVALARDPQFADAAHNLEVAREIVDYVETARQQSDTGEETGEGADDVVLDNEANRGVETEIDAPADADGGLLTAAEWMRTVDTRTGDFLRQRFAVEAARQTPVAKSAPAPRAGENLP